MRPTSGQWDRMNQQLKTTSEQLKASQAAKNAFFAKISHEMRTPLNGVVSAIALLEDTDSTEQREQLLKLAKESSQSLMQVINYVLDISKVENLEENPECVSFDLNALVSSVMDVVRAKAMEKGLQVFLDVDSRLARNYMADPSLLKQSLLNLVINAINFTVEGSVKLNVMPARKQGMSLRFEVTDTGIGISEQNQALIFEPFVTVTLFPLNSPTMAGRLRLGTSTSEYSYHDE